MIPTEQKITATYWPKQVGIVRIAPMTGITLFVWPNRFHRFMAKLLLGWTFERTDKT